MFFRLGIFSLAVLALSAVLASSQDEKPPVLVVSVTGTWTQKPQPPNPRNNPALDWGQCLQTNGFVYGQEGSSIVLTSAIKDCKEPAKSASDAQQSGLAYLCQQPDPSKYCSVNLDPSTWGRPWWAPFVAPFLALIGPNPDRYMVAVSRGVEEELVDSVAPIRGDGVDLSAAFHELGDGPYWVKLTSLSGASSPLGPLRLQYKRGAPAIVASGSIRPGLYKVLIVDQSGEPAGSDCWVLAATSADYPTLSNKFEQARAGSAKLPPEMDPSATRSLLRAYLESLADRETP